MASFVNRRTTDGRTFLPLPRRYNRTAVDRFASCCGGLSHHGVSVSLHQTLLHGSAALSRRRVAQTFGAFIVPRSAGGGRAERAGDHVSFASRSISPRSRSPLAPQPVLHARALVEPASIVGEFLGLVGSGELLHRRAHGLQVVAELVVQVAAHTGGGNRLAPRTARNRIAARLMVMVRAAMRLFPRFLSHAYQMMFSSVQSSGSGCHNPEAELV